MNRLFFIVLLSTVLTPISNYATAENDGAPELNKLYQEAIDLRSDGDLYGSIRALNQVLTSEPARNRARLEMAIAYYRAARYEEAIGNANAVLSDPNTPESVKETVQLFIDQVDGTREEDNKRRHSFSSSFTAGAGYDDNVNIGPGINVININGSTFTLLDTDERDASYGSISGTVNHSYRMKGSLDIGERPVSTVWNSGATIYRREYFSEHPYTVDVLSLTTGPGFISAGGWRSEIRLQADYIMLGDNALALFSSINPSFTWVEGVHEYNISSAWLYREFMTDEHITREGHRYSLGFDYGNRSFADWTLQAGVEAQQQGARTRAEEYETWEIYVGGYWTAIENTGIYGRLGYREIEHDGVVPIFNKGRTDREARYTLGADYTFVEGMLSSWSLEANLSYTDTDSSVAVYEYDRLEFSLDLTKEF